MYVEQLFHILAADFDESGCFLLLSFLTWSVFLQQNCEADLKWERFNVPV